MPGNRESKMKIICPAERLLRLGAAVMALAIGGAGCFSPLLAGIGGGSALYQHETANKSSSNTAQSGSSSKTKSKQNTTANASEANIE
jgi:hypothetical protein